METAVLFDTLVRIAQCTHFGDLCDAVLHGGRSGIQGSSFFLFLFLDLF